MAKTKTLAPEKKPVPSKSANTVVETPKKKNAGAAKPAGAAASKEPDSKKSEAKALPRPSVTTVAAIVDTGWGNHLYLRGEGGGLSWEKGVPMTCNGGSEWVWVSTSNDPVFSFKFLLNDKFWSHGDNHAVTCGNTHQSRPTF